MTRFEYGWTRVYVGGAAFAVYGATPKLAATPNSRPRGGLGGSGWVYASVWLEGNTVTGATLESKLVGCHLPPLTGSGWQSLGIVCRRNGSYARKKNVSAVASHVGPGCECDCTDDDLFNCDDDSYFVCVDPSSSCYEGMPA